MKSEKLRADEIKLLAAIEIFASTHPNAAQIKFSKLHEIGAPSEERQICLLRHHKRSLNNKLEPRALAITGYLLIGEGENAALRPSGITFARLVKRNAEAA